MIKYRTAWTAMTIVLLMMYSVGCAKDNMDPNTDVTPTLQVESPAVSASSSPVIPSPTPIIPSIPKVTPSPTVTPIAHLSDSLSISTVVFTQKGEGWVGGNGFLKHTKDGGKSWSSYYEGTDTVLDLIFLNNGTGWMKQLNQNDGKVNLYYTVDSGVHWEKKFEIEYNDTLLFLNNTMGFVGNRLTQNGGKTWKVLSLPVNAVGNVYFSNEKVGWIFTYQDDKFFVERTMDGGQTWKSVYERYSKGGIMNALIRSSGPLDAWVEVIGGVGMNQAAYSLFHTSDGGAKWTSVLAHSSAGGGIAPGFATEKNAEASGPGAYPGTLIALSSKTAFLSGSCSPCGDNGEATIGWTKDGGKTWIEAQQKLSGQGSAISFLSENEGWLASSNTIYITKNGGENWNVLYTFK
ncbi:MAG: hypothetical protein JWM44_555 [Bacilli bacterium]|nr:hypothetical protein [Bacilli bacterium]